MLKSPPVQLPQCFRYDTAGFRQQHVLVLRASCQHAKCMPTANSPSQTAAGAGKCRGLSASIAMKCYRLLPTDTVLLYAAVLCLSSRQFAAYPLLNPVLQAHALSRFSISMQRMHGIEFRDRSPSMKAMLSPRSCNLARWEMPTGIWETHYRQSLPISSYFSGWGISCV